MTNNTPNAHVRGMTDEQKERFDGLMWHVERAFEECPFTPNNEELAVLEGHRDRLRDYVNGLLSEKYAEIERLRSENTTLTRLKDEVRRLSNVGELFDGRDECNEDTHEENNKVMEGALDRIWELVTGKAQVEELETAPVDMAGKRDWSSLMAEFEALLIGYLEAHEQDSDDGDFDDDLAMVAWEKLKDFFRQHVGTNAQGVPQSVVDAYEGYLKANDDDSSDNEFCNARMALIDAVGKVVNSQS